MAQQEELMADPAHSAFAGTCGFYCGSCSILAAYRKGQEQQRKLAYELSKHLKRTVPIHEIQCQGCSELSSFCWGHNCKIKSCARTKGVSFCYQCKLFPCETYRSFSDIYHDVPRIQSEELREAGSTEPWLEKMKARWTCVNCGGPVEADTMKCLSCNFNNRKNIEKTLPK